MSDKKKISVFNFGILKFVRKRKTVTEKVVSVSQPFAHRCSPPNKGTKTTSSNIKQKFSIKMFSFITFNKSFHVG